MKKIAFALLIVSCGGSKNNGPAPNGGVVPADLRDVERAGEGLVTTTFGDAAGGRMPAWDRAATVLGILKQVWGRSKTAWPMLPSTQVQMLDAAITKLDGAIAAKNQKDAVYGANQVGIAVPEIFDYFQPGAPKEVVRMDAVFRQLGIDAHFGDLNASKADAQSLMTDWGNLKGQVAMRAPMCHRVGGTATVVGEIDTSLANVMNAFGANDAATVEKESDNGALEIDTLELLYDCPADSAAPSSGTGAPCNAMKACDTGLECDMAWAANGGMGKCAPSASNKIGTPCVSTVDCGTDSRSACNNQAGDAYPGGYCFMEPCNDVDVCPPGATCVAIGGELPGCYKSCTSDGDCRTSEGYVCQQFSVQSPIGFGPTNFACAFPCTRDADCSMGLKCPKPFMMGDATSGKCTP